jgi:hypothetical protein
LKRKENKATTSGRDLMNAEESAVSENVPKGGEDKTSSRFQGHVVMNAP